MKFQGHEWIGLIGLVVPAIIFILATILNSYMREGLFLLGVNNIFGMQQNSGAILNFIENIFSMLGNPFCIFPVLILQYLIVKQRIRVLVHLTYLMIGLYFMAVLKQAFQESRPFWYSPNIKIIQWFCPTDFGNPSGHSFIFFAMYEPILSDFMGTGKKRAFLYIWVVVGVLVVISRMYLGAHSIDQVVFGSLIGLSFLVIYRFWLQQFLYDTYRQLLCQSSRLMYSIVTAILWLFFLIVPIVTYQLNVDQRPIDGDILANVSDQCHRDITGQDLQRKILFSTIAPFLPFGFIIGFVFTKNVDKEDSAFMVGLWAFEGTKSLVLYLLALLVVVGIPTGVLVLLIPKAITSVSLAFLIKVIGVTWAGFALVSPMGYIQRRYSLVTLHPND